MGASFGLSLKSKITFFAVEFGLAAIVTYFQQEWYVFAEASIVLFALLGAYNYWRRMEPWHIIAAGIAGLAISFAVTLGGVIWLYKTVPSISQASSKADVADGSTQISEAGKSAIEPRRFYSKSDKGRLSDALFELATINSVELRKISSDVLTVISPWLGSDPSLDASAAQQTIQKLSELSNRIGAVNDKIYRDLYSRYQPYSEELKSILKYDGDVADHPMTKLRASFPATSEALNTYIDLYKEYSIDKPNRKLTTLLHPTVTDIRLINIDFSNWVAENQMNIRNFREKILDSQE